VARRVTLTVEENRSTGYRVTALAPAFEVPGTRVVLLPESRGPELLVGGGHLVELTLDVPDDATEVVTEWVRPWDPEDRARREVHRL
jgi:hypothetical protein